MSLPIAVIIPVSIDQPLRLRNFRTILDYVLKKVQPEEIFVVEYSAHSELQWVRGKSDTIRYISYSLGADEPFSQARAINMCLDHVRHNCLIAWSVDFMVGLEEIKYCVDVTYSSSPQTSIVFPSPMTLMLSREESDAVRDWTTFDFSNASKLGTEKTFSVPLGIYVFNTSILRHTRGFCPLFEGWGSEDNEVKTRLSKFGPTPCINGRGIVHLYHDRPETVCKYNDTKTVDNNWAIQHFMDAKPKAELCQYLGITEDVGGIQQDLHNKFLNERSKSDLHGKFVNATVEVPR